MTKQAQPTSIVGSVSMAIVQSLSVITTSASAVNSLANAANSLAQVAENKASRFGELIELKDQMVYNAAKHELDQQMAALGLSTGEAAA